MKKVNCDHHARDSSFGLRQVWPKEGAGRRAPGEQEVPERRTHLP